MSIPPIPEPHPLSLRNAGRAFSFGRRKSGSPSVPLPGPPPPVPPKAQPLPNNTRERAFTESSYASGSTATPPKLLDTSLDLGQSDLEGFGSMFESFGKRGSRVDLGGSDMRVSRTESPVSLPSCVNI